MFLCAHCSEVWLRVRTLKSLSSATEQSYLLCKTFFPLLPSFEGKLIIDLLRLTMWIRKCCYYAHSLPQVLEILLCWESFLSALIKFLLKSLQWEFSFRRGGSFCVSAQGCRFASGGRCAADKSAAILLFESDGGLPTRRDGSAVLGGEMVIGD